MGNTKAFSAQWLVNTNNLESWQPKGIGRARQWSTDWLRLTFWSGEMVCNGILTGDHLLSGGE